MSESYSQDDGKAAVMTMKCESGSHPFHERHIIFDEVVKVGRSVARIRPASENAIFDCKVLSRNHALIWYRDGQFWLRDTNSSNGTFVNSTRVTKRVEDENADRELFSGDIIRFGVDVVENDTTHGSIITQISLRLPNGKEARLKEMYDDITQDMATSEPYHAEQLFLLTNSINKALFHEQTLETKLDSMKVLLEETQKMSEEGWLAMLNEEHLLESLQLYEDQLSLIKRNLPEESLQYCVTELQQEKFDLEKASKVMLERVISEKTEALTKAAKLESCLTDSERDCARLRKECESTQEAYQSITVNFDSKIAELERVEKQLREVADEKHRLESELVERSKDYQLLTEKLNGALCYNAPLKAPLTNHTASDQPGENNKDSFVAINGLDNGERTEQLGDIVEITGQLQNSLSRRADEVRDEVAVAELMELDRFCDIQERLANSELNLEHMLDSTCHDICNHISSNTHLLSHQHQSMQLIKALQAELEVLTSLKASIPNGDLSSTTSLSPETDSPGVDKQAATTVTSNDCSADTTGNASQFSDAPDKFSAALDRAKKLVVLVGACQTRDSPSCAESVSPTHPHTSGNAAAVSVPRQSSQSGAESEPSDDFLKTDLDQQQQRLLRDAITDNAPVLVDTPQFAVTTVMSSSAASLNDELIRMQDELRVSAKETEMYKQLAEKLKCQDDAKAELLLSVRKECDALRSRISQIESEVANNRVDHQRLVLEAKRARVDADELRQVRDQLTSELSASETKIDKLLQTQNAFNAKGNAMETHPDFPVVVSSTQEAAVPDQATESLCDGEVHRTAAGLLSVNGVSTTTTPQSSSARSSTEHTNQRTSVITMLPLVAVIPVMVLLCALMVFILSKFKP